MESWNWEALLSDEQPPKKQDIINAAVADVLIIRELGEHEKQLARYWVGSLRIAADEALKRLTPVFAKQNLTALIQEGSQKDEVKIVAMPGLVEPTSSRLWLAQLLFVLTIISTIVIGASPTSAPDGSVIWNWADGLMYSGTLLSILLAHELGHFIAARRLGVAVSYPFFIPMPLVIFGTMGAFIQMKEMPPDRRALFTIAVAGPLAGLVLAIPLTLLGLYLSTVEPLPTESGYILEGNSLLYAGMKFLIFGQWLPNSSQDVFLHPIAWAGWAGLLVTALNLLPAGQLDGGHVVFTLLGRRLGQIVTYGVIGLMIIMGVMWQGWWVWAVLILLLANRHVPILNDVTPLTERQRLIGFFMLVIFVLIFTPTPLTLVE